MNFNHKLGLYGVGRTSQVVTFKAGAAIVAGQTVMLDSAQTGEARAEYVVQGTAANAIGVAIAAQATVGGEVPVCVGGYCEGVKTDGAVTINLELMPGANGAAIPLTAGSVLAPFALALETDDATPVCDIYIYPRFASKT